MLIFSTGIINTGTSASGTYLVTNLIAAASGCSAVQSTATIIITQPYSGTISYNNPICKSSNVIQNVVNTITAGGIFSSVPTGLTLNTSSGAIQPNTSNAGAYVISYTIKLYFLQKLLWLGLPTKHQYMHRRCMSDILSIFHQAY